MKYLITENIESPSKVSKHIEAADFFFMVIYIGICVAIMGMVHEKLKVAYIIFSCVMAIFLTSKSIFNKKRRNYESIYLMLVHDLNVYKPIYGEADEE